MSWWPVRARGESRGCSVCVCVLCWGLGWGAVGGCLSVCPLESCGVTGRE